MKKLIAVMIVLALMMPVLTAPVFAAKAGKGVVDAGNKMCPVSGDPVSGKNFVVYKGMRYGLCCPMCKKPFLKDPEKYLAAMGKGKPAGMAGMAGMKMDMPAQVQSTEKKAT